MRKLFQYRLSPTKKQVKKLNETLEECRWLYNHLLEQRKSAYEQEGKSLSLYQQQETFSVLKQQRPCLQQVHSQVLQNVAVGIDLAMKAFLRRIREGEKPGYLVFVEPIALTASRSLNRGSPSPTMSLFASPRSAG